MANRRAGNGRQDRLRLMAEDVALDMTIRRLAEKYGVSVTQAHADVKAIKRDWLRSRNAAIEAARAVQAARLVRFIGEMWEAWFASRGVQFKVRERQVPGELVQVEGVVIGGDGVSRTELLTPGEMVTVEATKESAFSPGNPRFAEQILGAYDQLARIEGLYSAQEVTVNIKALVEQEAARLGLDARKVMAEIDEIAEGAWGRTG